MPPISDVRCCRPRSGTNGRKSQTYTFKQLKLRLNYDCPRSDSRLSGVDTSEIYVMFGSCFSVAKYSFGSSSCWLTIPVMYVDGHTTCVSFMERHHLSVLFLNSFEFFDRTAILTEDVRPLLLQTPVRDLVHHLLVGHLFCREPPMFSANSPHQSAGQEQIHTTLMVERRRCLPAAS